MWITSIHRTAITGKEGQIIRPGEKVQVTDDIGQALIDKGLAKGDESKPKQDSTKKSSASD